mgnify:CR=1 FL=1
MPMMRQHYTQKIEQKTIYEILIDYHLDKKNIKGHNNVYFDIQNNYPKKKWLNQNDNKFLPAILDSYGKIYLLEVNLNGEDSK